MIAASCAITDSHEEVEPRQRPKTGAGGQDREGGNLSGDHKLVVPQDSWIKTVNKEAAQEESAVVTRGGDS